MVSLGKLGRYSETRDCAEIDTFLLQSNGSVIVPLIDEVERKYSLDDFVIIAMKADCTDIPYFNTQFLDQQAQNAHWPRQKYEALAEFLSMQMHNYSYIAITRLVY